VSASLPLSAKAAGANSAIAIASPRAGASREVIVFPPVQCIVSCSRPAGLMRRSRPAGRVQRLHAGGAGAIGGQIGMGGEPDVALGLRVANDLVQDEDPGTMADVMRVHGQLEQPAFFPG